MSDMSEANTRQGGNFWRDLKKPIIVQAPMANVTDAAFRRMFAKYGPPDVFWTEFVSVEGLLSRGRSALLVDFWKSDAEHPIVAQIFGSKPEQFEEVAKMVRELGFHGVDINMGCPDRGVEKSLAGAALIKNPELAREIIRATKRGWVAGGRDINSTNKPRSSSSQDNDLENSRGVPVSVKTRIGYAKDEIDTWIAALLEEQPAALTVHLRTRNEMSDVPAHWDLAPRIVALRDRISPNTILLGNGDVESLEDARARVAASGMDGAMIGRGMFGNPWVFNKASGGRALNTQEKLRALIEHTELFESLYNSAGDGQSNAAPQKLIEHTVPLLRSGRIKNFDIMKKHFKAYCTGFDGAKDLRIALMERENAADVKKITEAFLMGENK